jgi:hypothetical protein
VQARNGCIAVLWVTLASCARAHPAVGPASAVAIQAQPRIVTPDEVITETELAARAAKALADQRWRDAARDYGTLVSAEPDGPLVAEYLFDQGLALEGCQQRARARDTFLDLSRRFPGSARARVALVRAATLDAYLEDWSALEAIGEALLAQEGADDIERLVALGARGLGRVELGDDRAASQDILDGLELADRLHYGARDVLPVAVAELHFALGEVRRVRSERIQLGPLAPDFRDEDFLGPLDRRCGGLLEAQAAYAQAVRSVDPHWAAMAGYRVGEMYRALHADLMRLSPDASKSEAKKQMFYAFMHVRYRVLLEKGLREIEQTIALGERIADSSLWIERARGAKAQMLAVLDDERAQIAAMPFTEAEVQEALNQLQKKTKSSR